MTISAFRMVAVVVALLGTTGCVAPGPTTSSAAPGTPTVAASAPPSPSPSPNARVAQPGQSRVPAACADLMPAALLNQRIGAGAVLKPAPASATPATAAARQAGLLSCEWTSAQGHVSLSVFVDGEPVFPGTTTAAGEPLANRADGFSEDSVTVCDRGGGGHSCSLGGVTGQYRFSASWRTSMQVPSDSAALDSGDALGATVTEALRATGEPLEAAFAEPSSNDPFDCEGIDPSGVVRSALSADLDGPAPPGTDFSDPMEIWGWTRTGYRWCTWRGSVATVRIEMLPGGSWAWNPDRLAAEGYTRPRSIPDAIGARARCDDAEDDSAEAACEVVLAAGDTLLLVEVRAAGPAESARGADAIAEAWVAEYLR